MPIVSRSLAHLPFALALSTPLVALPAHAADPKQACFDAYPAAQKLRKGGKLRRARAELVTCSQDACPAAVRKDCTDWLNEVSAELPSIVVVATDAAGKDTAAVRVTVDGEVAAARLDGKAIEIDPGERVLRFEHGGSTVEQALVVRQGERNRTVAVSFAAPSSSPPPSSPSEGTRSSPGDRPPSSPTRPVPVAVYVLGGVGVASLATGAYFYFAQKSLHDDLAARCAPACSPDDVAPLKTKQLLGGVFAGVGVAALATAVVLYVGRKEDDSAIAALSVGPVPGGAALSLRGGF